MKNYRYDYGTEGVEYIFLNSSTLRANALHQNKIFPNNTTYRFEKINLFNLAISNVLSYLEENNKQLNAF